MGKKKNKTEELKSVVAEFKVSMYCNACERTVAKAISKFKGVEKFTTDMNKHRVEVTGRIDPEKLMKKLKKKTGKRVEIIVDDDNNNNNNEEEDSSNGNYYEEFINKKDNGVVGDDHPLSFFECCKNNEGLLMLSDENPNACSIM